MKKAKYLLDEFIYNLILCLRERFVFYFYQTINRTLFICDIVSSQVYSNLKLKQNSWHSISVCSVLFQISVTQSFFLLLCFMGNQPSRVIQCQRHPCLRKAVILFNA